MGIIQSKAVVVVVVMLMAMGTIQVWLHASPIGIDKTLN
jgi:hypothetical protein